MKIKLFKKCQKKEKQETKKNVFQKDQNCQNVNYHKTENVIKYNTNNDKK